MRQTNAGQGNGDKGIRNGGRQTAPVFLVLSPFRSLPDGDGETQFPTSAAIPFPAKHRKILAGIEGGVQMNGGKLPDQVHELAAQLAESVDVRLP